MDVYLIVLTDHKTGSLESIIRRLKDQRTLPENRPDFYPVTYIQALDSSGEYSVKQSDDCNKDEATFWHRLDTRNINCANEGDHTASAAGSQSDGRFTVADRLHEIADNLPSDGCYVEVIVSLSNSSVQTIGPESLVLLYACLKRLRTWHNAVIRIVTGESRGENLPLLQWRNFLQAEVIESVNEIRVPVSCSVWRGQAVVLDSRRNVVFCLRDMCLELQSRGTAEPVAIDGHGVRLVNNGYERAVDYLNSRDLADLSLSRSLEILDEVDVVTVPSFLLAPCSLHLKANNQDCVNEFLQHVQRSNEVGYILRIGYQRKSDVKICGCGTRSTQSWKEAVSANTTSIYDVMDSDLDLDGYLHLLLTGNSPGDNPDSRIVGECTAYVLRSPEEINGSIIEMLHKNWLKNPSIETEGSTDVVGSIVQSVPVWNLSDLQRLGEDIVRAQRGVLQAWLNERQERGESVHMTERELMTVLQDVHRHMIQTAREEWSATEMPDYKPYKLWCYEGSSAESEEWPEKKCLRLQENCSRNMSRFVSSDSLQQSSPIQPTEGGEKSVDVGDFLKLFKPDGSAAGACLSALQGKQSGSVFSKFSSFDDRVIGWPESKDVKFHDIYYNGGRKCEKLEMECFRLKQRQLGSETRSTVSSSSSGVLDHSCSTIKPKSLKKVSRSPVRRSPRKHPPPRERLSAPIVRDQRRIELCPKPNPKDTSMSRKKSVNEPLSQLSTERQKSPSKSKPTGSLPKEDVPPSETTATEKKQDLKKNSRSDRHKKRLQQIVHDVLKTKGVRSGDVIYKACATKLFTVTKLYAMELPTSRNLVGEMTKIAEGQVQQVIDLEMMKRKSSNPSK